MASKRPPSDGETTEGAITNRQHSRLPIRLLLHAVDGALPLTPNLLQKCFPASKVSEQLWIGVAVRDTCIKPVFQQKPSRKKKDSADNHDDKKKKLPPKPSGYTFSDSTTLDPWLLPYTRVTVPTFDMVQDAAQFAPRNNPDPTSGSSNKHVLVWTENGRMTLTPQVYGKAARGLQSHATVSLYDVVPTSAKNRRLVSAERTSQWFQTALEEGDNHVQKEQKDSQPDLWASYAIAAVPPSDDNEEQSAHDQSREVQRQLDTLKAAIDNNRITGVVFVGWQYAATPTEQRLLLQRAMKSLARKQPKDDSAATAALHRVVLSAGSLGQFLDAAILGIDVLGTDLPAKWAKDKHAFLCDLEHWRPGQLQQKRAKISKSENVESGDSVDNGKVTLDEDGCFNLTPPLDGTSSSSAIPWFRDDRPLLPGCSCLTCSTHSREYLYHLVVTKELLSEILLFIHNLHHMLLLCRELTDALEEGKEDDLLRHVTLQLPTLS